MDKEKLIELAERCEGAKEGHQPGLIWEAGAAVFGDGFEGDSHSKAKWFVQYAQAEAWHDAAMSLVPEGDGICLNMGQGPWAGHFARVWNVSAELAAEGKNACEWEVDGCSPHSLPLALLAACLRAIASGGEG